MYRKILKPILFLFQPEAAHHFVFASMKIIFKIPLLWRIVRRYYSVEDEKLKRTVFGIDFANPVGVAAGLDKNATMFDELFCFGFGCVEIGTVTPVAQKGNPKPRMFRLIKDEVIINRMGFNNDGVKRIAERLRKRKSNVIIGGNIGKNKNTPNEKAIEDYEICFRELYDVVDYFVVNVSSPNTPGLRELQEKEPLKKILFRLKEISEELCAVATPSPSERVGVRHKPILLKIAPDLTNEQLDEIVEVVLETKLDGIVATNTTINRENLKASKAEIENCGSGGLSGKPLTKRSTEVISYLHKKSQGKFSIVGVGGIHSAEDAIEKLNAGASLVQLYTGFIYEGPGLVKKICKRLLED